MPQLIIKSQIEIAASQARVWEVLTDPAYTVQYMFNCKPVTDWRVGSRLNWRGAADGKDYVTGLVEHYQPPRMLRFSTFDPHSTIPDIQENYVPVTYDLIRSENNTILIVTQGDFATVADGEKRFKETGAGWDMVLARVKELAEQPLDESGPATLC
jgi:uncharacterized protein YndB with AHSA1/START domain